jgi:hypothetical protein
LGSERGCEPKQSGEGDWFDRKELRKFVKRGVTKEELADNQANYIGRLPLSLESNHGVVNALLNIHRYDLGMDYYQRYEGLVRSLYARGCGRNCAEIYRSRAFGHRYCGTMKHGVRELAPVF